MLSLSGMKKSFQHAWKGLKFVYKSEQNFRFQVVVAIITLSLSIIFPLRNWEIIIISRIINLTSINFIKNLLIMF